MRYTVFIAIIFLITGRVFAQTPYVVVDSIYINGNIKTKDYIIFNELDFNTGDTIYFDKLKKVFRDNKYRILSTGLFVNTNFNLKKYDSSTSRGIISIKLNEAWYLYPTLNFELTDRNFNEWITEHNASLKRINIAVGLKHLNLSGNNDFTEVKIQTGVTKKLELDYKRPFLSAMYRIGFSMNVLYKFSKEIAYNTFHNKLLYVKDDNRNIYGQWRATTAVNWRPGVFNTHNLSLEYNNITVADSILEKYNPRYINTGHRQQSLSISYTFEHEKRQFQMYPKGGHYIGFTLEKTGLGIFNDIDIFNAYMEIQKYFSLRSRFISAYILKGKKHIAGYKIPYFNNKALGYNGDYLNGYELYVIDGEDYFYAKTSQKLKLFKGNLNLGGISPVRQFKIIPYDIYFSFNFDAGYVNNNINFADNSFTNRWLYGYGVGFDINIYQNYFQLNFSINHLKETGIFFHFKTKL